MGEDKPPTPSSIAKHRQKGRVPIFRIARIVSHWRSLHAPPNFSRPKSRSVNVSSRSSTSPPRVVLALASNQPPPTSTLSHRINMRLPPPALDPRSDVTWRISLVAGFWPWPWVVELGWGEEVAPISHSYDKGRRYVAAFVVAWDRP